jgi:phage gpG-like protein
MNWQGEAVLARVKRGVVHNLRIAAITLQNELKRVLSRSGQTGFAGDSNATSRNQQQAAGNKPLWKRAAARRELVGLTFKNRSSFARYGGDKVKFWTNSNGGPNQSKIVGQKLGNSQMLSITTHSRPGEPPRRQSGQLRASVTHELIESPQMARVGTNVKHGRYMEFGVKGGKIIVPKSAKVLVDFQTRRFFGRKVVQGAIAPRPWLHPTAIRMKGEIAAILATPIPVA